MLRNRSIEPPFAERKVGRTEENMGAFGQKGTENTDIPHNLEKISKVTKGFNPSLRLSFFSHRTSSKEKAQKQKEEEFSRNHCRIQVLKKQATPDSLTEKKKKKKTRESNHKEEAEVGEYSEEHVTV